MLANSNANGCTSQVAKFTKDNNMLSVGGRIPMTQFASDHVFEIHLIADFLEWLCVTTSRLSCFNGDIPFPTGRGQPDSTWCKDVIRSKSSFTMLCF